MEAKLHEPGTVIQFEIEGVILQSEPVPQVHCFGRSDTTEQLYRTEKLALDSVKVAALVLARLLGWDCHQEHPDFYSKAVPAALVALLDSFTLTIGVAAAVGYLGHYGIAVALPVAGEAEHGTDGNDAGAEAQVVE
jgi:hypothetical protein